MSPFDFMGMRYTFHHDNMIKVIKDVVESEQHLLECMHTIILFFKMQDEMEGSKPVLHHKIHNLFDYYMENTGVRGMANKQRPTQRVFIHV